MTPEQKQRIEQIRKKREQQRNRPMLAVEGVAWGDVDLLLSLVKSQEAPIAIEMLKDLHDSDCLYVTHNGACDCAEGVVVNRAAASMRSTCVEKVKTMISAGDERGWDDGYGQVWRQACAEIITALELLSIEKSPGDD